MSRFGQRTRTTTLVSSWMPASPAIPLSLNPVMWLDASDTATIISSSGAVSQWSDKSGNVYNLTQSTATNQPVTGSNTINGLNVIRFDGSNDWMGNTNNPPSIASGPWAAFVVAKASSAVTTVRSLVNPASGASGAGYLATVSSVRYANMFTASALQGPATTDTDTNVYYFLNNGSSSQIGVNTTFTTVTSTSAARGPGFTLGANVGRTAEFFNGDIGEVLFFTYALSDSQRDLVRGYLATKWGL